MPSERYKRALGAVSSSDVVLVLLEITHPDMPAPARVVRDTQDLVSNGNVFVATGFDFTFPDDKGAAAPRAELVVDNIGRELMSWIEASKGGRGAEVRLMIVLRETPDVIEADYRLGLERIVVETDAPYMAPVPMRGKRNDSRYLPYVIEKLAEWKGVTAEEMTRVTWENGRRLFGIG